MNWRALVKGSSSYFQDLQAGVDPADRYPDKNTPALVSMGGQNLRTSGWNLKKFVRFEATNEGLRAKSHFLPFIPVKRTFLAPWSDIRIVDVLSGGIERVVVEIGTPPVAGTLIDSGVWNKIVQSANQPILNVSTNSESLKQKVLIFCSFVIPVIFLELIYFTVMREGFFKDLGILEIIVVAISLSLLQTPRYWRNFS